MTSKMSNAVVAGLRTTGTGSGSDGIWSVRGDLLMGTLDQFYKKLISYRSGRPLSFQCVACFPFLFRVEHVALKPSDHAMHDLFVVFLEHHGVPLP